MNRLLYVEDETDFTEYLENELRDHFDITTALDASEAIGLLTAKSFEYIILDISYDGIGSAKNILDFREVIKSHNSSKIYLVSGDKFKATELISLYDFLNMEDFYLKPEGYFKLIEILKIKES